MSSRITAALTAIAASTIAGAQPAAVEITTIPVAGGVFMLQGSGGNLGVSIGDDGVFLIDDQFANMTGAILAAIGQLGDGDLRFVVNTHWHGDHTGGNENLGAEGAVIVAHDNVRRRMSTEQFMEAFNRRTPASPPGALPVITFTDAVTFHFNGDDVQVEHVAPAHTDGDSFVYFRKTNVLHTGDLYFSESYPFIDVSSGGSLQGMIDAADRLLAIVDDQTRIIPGHGALSDTAGLRAYRDMLRTAHDQIAPLVERGLDRQAVIDARPTAALDGTWGGGWMKPDLWVGIVYDGMTRDTSRDHSKSR